jgi:DNA polymerase V
MILHADGNSFFASCEQLFRPDLRGRPVIVLSNNDGIIVALTKEAKAVGLKRGDPYFKVKHQCEENHVAVFSSNYTLYADISRRITSIYLEYAPKIEVYSIDESFLFFPDFSSSEIESICIDLRKKILREVGMPICVGAAPTKTLAKWYNKHAKLHDGVYVYDGNTIDAELQNTPCGDIWGIGPSRAFTLASIGVTNALQLKHLRLDIAKKYLTLQGAATVQELNCIEAIDEVSREKKQVVTSSRQFGKRVYDLKSVECALAQYTERAVEKLRKQKCEAGGVCVYLSTCREFSIGGEAMERYANAAYAKLCRMTSYTPDIVNTALDCLHNIWRYGYGYKTVMVTLTDIKDEAFQGELFISPLADEKRRHLMQACDALNAHYGRTTVSLAKALSIASSGNGDWEMRREHLSPCYTTRVSDLPVVM